MDPIKEEEKKPETKTLEELIQANNLLDKRVALLEQQIIELIRFLAIITA